MTTEDRKWFFGYGNPFGDDTVDNVFYDNILPILKQYNFNDKDIVLMVRNINDMCSTAYFNGYDNCEFEKSQEC